jgi:hypothetical protein
MAQTTRASSSNSKKTKSKAASKSSAAKTKAKAKPERSSYDRLKEFGGRRYTGMAVGRGHKWEYEAGEWVEKKTTPDKWEFHYDVRKRRTGKAPEGSGAPVGSGYHWFILAHQTATKLDANNYLTKMKGLKYKLAHRRAESANWNASERAQRRRLIALLKETIAELESQDQQDEKTAPEAAPRARRLAA